MNKDSKNGFNNNFFKKMNELFQKSLLLKKLKNVIYFVDAIMCIFIKKPKKVESNKKSIVIIYNLAMGDGIILSNCLREIRNIYPSKDYEITIFIQSGLEELYEDLSLDNVLSINFSKSTVKLRERYKSLKKIRSKRYDILLDPVGANECLTNVLFSRRVLASKKIGCINNNYDVNCPSFIQKKTYTEFRYLNEKSLIGLLNEFFYNRSDIKLYHNKDIKLNFDIPKKYFVIFPSASGDLKKWPLERYSKIINKVYKETKLPIVFCGTKSDFITVDSLKKIISAIPVYDIIGKTTILEFIQVIKNAQFVITNDTGAYHIAVINEVPVAVISGGYLYSKYIEYNFKNKDKYKQPYIVAKNNKCFNCNYNCKRLKQGQNIWPCLEEISVDDAWKVIQKMLKNEGVEHGQ